jgi:hypothetical protein
MASKIMLQYRAEGRAALIESCENLAAASGQPWVSRVALAEPPLLRQLQQAAGGDREVY